MLPVDADRAVMGFSLFIHIILASVGMAMPVVILLLEFLGIRKEDQQYTKFAKKLTLIFLVLFAVGSASGVLVAVEFFLLWPKFATVVSQVAITPMYIEVFAFFMETIFLGIYTYSWDRFKGKYSHLLTGIPVAIGGGLSALFIIIVNAFMNTPVGFNIPEYLSSGVIADVHPFAVFTSPSVGIEVSHGVFASYFAGSMIIAGYIAYRMVREKSTGMLQYYRKALAVALAVSFVTVIFSVITGVISIQSLAYIQPEKYAAIEGDLYPHANAAEIIGGIPVNNSTALAYYISIPNLQSILLAGSPNATVPGLSSYPRSTWPPLIVHVMFDLMLFLGIVLAVVFIVLLGMQLARMNPLGKRYVLLVILASSIAAVAVLETGWVMAEFARQPWILYDVMTVAQAANYSPGILPVAFGILAFYIVIIPFTLLVIRKLLRRQNL